MLRLRAIALVALLVAAAMCATATPAAVDPPHVAAARDWLMSSTATVDDALVYMDIVACFLNVSMSTLDDVHLQAPHRARPTGDVVSNLALAAPATEVGVGVNDKGVVMSLRFVTAAVDAKCGFWDPGAEVIVRGEPGTALANIRIDMSQLPTPLLTVTSLRFEFARLEADGALPERLTSEAAPGGTASAAYKRRPLISRSKRTYFERATGGRGV